MDSSNSPTTKPLYRGTQALWYILGFVEILVLFRVILKLLGANPTAGFSRLIYEASYVFVAPFQNVFRGTYVDASIFEWTSVLAMLVYWVLAIGIIKLLLMTKTVSTPEAARSLREEDA